MGRVIAMTRVFTWQFEVRSYELDASGHVHHAVYSNYLEEGATRASTDAGYSYHWYMDRHRAWVIRKMIIRYLTPLRHGDQVILRTWVSDFSRIYSHREYDLRLLPDNRPVVRARAKWVYIDLDDMRPMRIPAEMEANFDPSGEQEDIEVRPRGATPLEDGPSYVSRRRVQRYELDPAGHVNNAVYLNWFEQAMVDALASVGWSGERLREIGLGMVQVAHEVDYLRPALDGALLQIVSRPTELAATMGAWQHEVRQAESGDVLARDYSVGTFLDLNTGQPCPLPGPVLESLLRGPST